MNVRSINANPSGFNPRTRESATLDSVIFQVMQVVSIHALVRVRLIRDFLLGFINKFQSTHS